MQPIAEALSHVELGSPVHVLNLTLFPLLVADEATHRYAMLDEALALKTARVTEVSKSGSVPESLFVNDGARRILNWEIKGRHTLRPGYRKGPNRRSTA